MLVFGWRSSESFLCSIPPLKNTSALWHPTAFLPWLGCRGPGRPTQGAGGQAGGTKGLCWGRGKVGGKQGPEPAALGFGAGGFSKTKHQPLKEKPKRRLREKAALELKIGMACGDGRKISWWLCKGK